MQPWFCIQKVDSSIDEQTMHKVSEHDDRCMPIKNSFHAGSAEHLYLSVIYLSYSDNIWVTTPKELTINLIV